MVALSTSKPPTITLKLSSFQRPESMTENDYRQLLMNEQQNQHKERNQQDHTQQERNPQERNPQERNPLQRRQWGDPSQKKQGNARRQWGDPSVDLTEKDLQSSVVVDVPSLDESTREVLQAYTKKLNRKNRVLEDLERRHEYDLANLTFRVQEQNDEVAAKLRERIEDLKRENNKLKKEIKNVHERYDYVNREASQMRMMLNSQTHLGSQSYQPSQQFSIHEAHSHQTPHVQNSPQQLPSQHLHASQISSKRASDAIKLKKAYQEIEELQNKLSLLEEKYSRAESLVKALEKQKRKLEKTGKTIIQKFDKDKEINQMRHHVIQAKKESQQNSNRVSLIESENIELKKTNKQLKQMNERYFAVLKTLGETEQRLLSKEVELNHIQEKYAATKKENRRLKRLLNEQ